VFWFSLQLFKWNISYPKKSASYDHNCTWVCKAIVVLVRFKLKGIFSTDLRKKLKHQISWKSVQWEHSCFVRMERHEEANSRNSQFAQKNKCSYKNPITHSCDVCLHENKWIAKLNSACGNVSWLNLRVKFNTLCDFLNRRCWGLLPILKGNLHPDY
jgi:hypothetical protein